MEEKGALTGNFAGCSFQKMEGISQNFSHLACGNIIDPTASITAEIQSDLNFDTYSV